MILLLAWPARAETWAVECGENFPPFNFMQDGKVVGLDVEIVAAVLHEIGVEEALETYPWNRALDRLDSGAADALFQVVDTPERRARYLLIGPLRVGRTVFFVPSGSSIAYETLDDLKPYRIGVIRGYAYTEEFDAATTLQKLPARESVTLLRMLAGGRVDLAIGDATALSYLIEQQGLTGRLHMLPKVLQEVPRYVAFGKSAPDKAARFGRGLEKLRADGTLDRIIAHWERPTG